MHDTTSTWHSALNASVYCTNTFGTDLGSFASESDIQSYRNIASANNLYQQPCWLGLFDTTGNNLGWDWLDPDTSYSFNLSSTQTAYDFNAVDQRCAYFFPGNAEINDWYCYKYDQITNGSTNFDVASCFVCNKPSKRNYTIRVGTGLASDTAGTEGNMWFRIQGSIENVTESERWTEWFSVVGFTDDLTVYRFTRELTNVGNITKLIILNQQSDGLLLYALAADGSVLDYINSVAGGIWIDYDNGMYSK